MQDPLARQVRSPCQVKGGMDGDGSQVEVEGGLIWSGAGRWSSII